MTTATAPTAVVSPAVAAPVASATRDRWVLIAACAGVLTLALWNTLHKSIWTDEAYTLLTSHQTFARTWHQALHFELQPPVYFLLLNGWLRLGGTTVEWARVFSTLCVLGCVAVLWTCERATWTGRGVPASLVAVVTATVVWAATEARDYGLVLLLSATTYWLFLGLVTGRSRHPRRDAVVYGLVAYLSLLTMYYSGFILVGQWVAALVVRRSRWLLTASLAGVAVAMIPWVPTIIGQMGGHTNLNLPFAAEVAQSVLPGGAFTLVLREVLGALFATSQALDHRYGALSLTAVLAIVPAIRLGGLIYGRRAPSVTGAPRWGADETALSVAVAVSALSLVLLRVTNVAFVWPRHMAALTPGFLLLWSLWITRAPSVVWARIASAALLVVCMITLASFERNLDVEDARGAAHYVAAQRSPEPILVVGPEAVFPFRYYYRGTDRGTAAVYGVPRDASLDTYDPDSMTLTDPAQIRTRVAAARVQHGFWIVVSKRYVWQSAPAAAALDSFLHAQATASDSTDFRNVYVVHAVLHDSGQR
jgi:hypothetical protein